MLHTMIIPEQQINRSARREKRPRMATSRLCSTGVTYRRFCLPLSDSRITFSKLAGKWGFERGYCIRRLSSDQIKPNENGFH